MSHRPTDSSSFQCGTGQTAARSRSPLLDAVFPTLSVRPGHPSIQVPMLSRVAVQPERGLRMSNADIIRAWKDPDYRLMLADVPPNPAGQIELADPDLDSTFVVNSTRFHRTHRHCSTDYLCPTGCGVCCRTTV